MPPDSDQTSPTGTPNTSLLDKQIGKALDERGVKSGGGRGGGDGVSERLSRLEGAFEQALEGIRHGQNLMLGIIGIGFAIVVAVLVYLVQRVDNLPSDFLRINQTLTSAITAAKQQPPQVILLPAQLAPQKSPEPSKSSH